MSHADHSGTHTSTGAFALRGTIVETSPKSSLEQHYATGQRDAGMRASLPVKAVSSLERSYLKDERGSAKKPMLDSMAIKTAGNDYRGAPRTTHIKDREHHHDNDDSFS